MNRITSRRAATFGIAAAAALLAVQGTADSATHDAGACTTWHPQPSSDVVRQDWNPLLPATGVRDRFWSADGPAAERSWDSPWDGGDRHPWNPPHDAHDRPHHWETPLTPLPDGCPDG